MSIETAKRWHLRPLMITGYVTLFVFLFGIAAWGAVTRIAGAVVSAGQLEVEGNRQVVQHPTGGVIEAINARDGAQVEVGDVLIRLEGQSVVSELGIVEGQWYEILARKSRLSAERDGLDAITFDPELIARAGERPELATLIEAQSQQFEARRKLQDEESQQIGEQQQQIAKQIDGLISLQDATDSQIDLLVREIEGQEALLAQGLTQITRVLTPQRELARLRGAAGQVEASVAESRGKIAELEIERVRLVSETREEAIAELRDLEFREIELRERRHSLLDQIEKLDLRAPVSGVVYGSTADTLRGVIRPAEPVMYIVPRDTPLVVRTKIEPIHIDQVYVGQEAVLHFSAFDRRTTPEVSGHVISVSADAIEDQQRGIRYYRADIELDDGMKAKLGDKIVILPGMPVEAFISTEERSPLSFFVKPMTDYFNRAFREG
jgi:HlyD family secretion protein